MNPSSKKHPNTIKQSQIFMFYKPPNCSTMKTHLFFLLKFSLIGILPLSCDLAGFRNAEMSSPRSHQFQSNYSPDQRMYQPQGYGHSSSFQRNPIAISRPFTMHQENPGAWNQSGGTVNYDVSSNLSSESNFPSPGYGPALSPRFNSGQGRGQWYNHRPNPVSGYGGSPSPNSQRGGGRWYGGRPIYGSRHTSGTGLGSRGRGPAMNSSLGPEKFYNDSMVEDPWKSLPPVIWSGVESSSNISVSAESSKFSSASFSAKRTKASEASNKFSSQPSLAEYLASSLIETTQDEPNT